MNKSILLCIMYALMGTCYGKNKIICVLSTPRSLSTAFLRMIQARGDFTIFHEPSQHAFNLITWPEIAQQVYLENAPNTFTRVKEIIFEAACHTPVFTKEMVSSVKDFMIQDEEFLSHPDIYFVFLLRAPQDTVISYCKRSIKIPDDLSHRVGCKAMYELLQIIKQKAKHAPLLILSEDLYKDPSVIVKTFCNHVSILFNEQSLQWENLGPNFTGAAWNDFKKAEFVQRFHGDAIRSTGFGKPGAYAVRARCIQAYEENLPYYQLLIAEMKQ